MTTVEERRSAVPAGLGSAHVARRRRRSRQRTLHWVATHAIALAVAIVFVVPLVFVFLTALMSDDQALTSSLWPRHWQWSNFSSVFDQAPMLRWLGNSVLYAGLATVFTLVSSLPVAYALARIRFRGRKIILLAVIGTMMLPPQVTVVPLYIIWARLHLTGTLWPLVVPTLFTDAFSVFLLRQFLIGLPQEYVDAARVDGCGEFRILVRVIVPMINRHSPPSGCSSSSMRGTTITGRSCSPARIRTTGRCRWASPRSADYTTSSGT